MGKHDQKGRPPTKFACEECKVDNCLACLDTIRLYRQNLLCECGKRDHAAIVLSIRVSKIAAARALSPVKAECITCPQCGASSYNLADIREAYCANCRQWVWEMGLS